MRQANVQGRTFHKEIMIFANLKIYKTFVKGPTLHICDPVRGVSYEPTAA